MKKHTIKFITALMGTAILFVACSEKDSNDIVGEWQWKGTTVHQFYDNTSLDTTYSEEYPIFKDLAFYENNKVDVLQQGVSIPEDKPSYFTYQYEYNISTAGDVIQLIDPQGDYYPQTWTVKSLTKKTLILEYTIMSGDQIGSGASTITATYHRE